MNTKAKKLHLIEQILKIKDEDLIQALEKLLDFGLKHQTGSASDDFWDELSSSQKERIEASIKELEEGKGIAHEEVMEFFRGKLQR